MRRKLKMKKGKERYKLRKELPEPVFGQVKQAPGFGNSYSGAERRCTASGVLFVLGITY
jgi:hypothetical protein